jgi:hypothetical protein
MEDKEFGILLSACSEVARMFPDGVVYIGGIAVYLHAINVRSTMDFAEFTHDADFYISFADMSDLRDIEEVTPNRRLSKHQMIKKGFEFDIYTERQSSLIVPYDMVLPHSKVYEGCRVASLEHLFVLKLEAFADRKGSLKGDKDAKDLIRIAAIAKRGPDGFNAKLVAPYLKDTHKELIAFIEKGSHFMSIAKGNAMEAKKLRHEFSELVKELLHGANVHEKDINKSLPPAKTRKRAPR